MVVTEDDYIGQKLSKKPTSSVRFGKIHNFSFPMVAMKQRRKRIYLQIYVEYIKYTCKLRMALNQSRDHTQGIDEIYCLLSDHFEVRK